jgi:alpha-tubulin suppressor-like RCC1 family protein
MSSRNTNFKRSDGVDVARDFIDKDYLLSVYPQIPQGGLRLYGWGGNFSGQLGDNTKLLPRSTPRQEFSSSTNWKQVSNADSSTGLGLAGAVKTDGTLWMWGYNPYGQLGTNDTITRSTPTQVGTATNWKQVACGYFNTTAVKTDGTLWSWGLYSDELFGIRSTPKQVGNETNWKSVLCGKAHRGALKYDGTLWMWGDNGYGQLGLNDRTDRYTPVQEITSSTNWKQIVGGEDFTVAVKTDGTLWAWGSNYSGQLGDNTTAYRSTPRQIGTATDWKTVSAGKSHAAAIKTDGTLWAWGSNSYRIVDYTSASYRSTPRQEGTSATNWKLVSSGYGYINAIKTDGTLWSWGRNNQGQLGNNTTSSSSLPRQEFTSNTNWVQLSSTWGRSCLAIQAPGYID